LAQMVDPNRLRTQVATVTTHAADVKAGLGAQPDPGVVKAIDAIQGLSAVRTALTQGQAGPDKLLPAYGGVIKGLIDALRLEDGVDVKTSEGRQVLGLDASLRTEEDISIAAVDLMVAVIAKDPRALAPYMADVAVLQAQANRLTTFATDAQSHLYNQVQNEANARLGKDFTGATDSNPLATFAKLTPQLVFPALESLVGIGRVVDQKII